MLDYSLLAGNVIRFRLIFRDVDGIYVDPTTVTCKAGASDDDADTLAVVKDATGRYHADWDTTGLAAGSYYCKATGSGSVVAAKEIMVRLKAAHLS